MNSNLPLNGAYPSRFVKKLMQSGAIIGAQESNVQPSSLDLTISDEIYKMKGIFLPQRSESVRALLKAGVLYRTDLSKPLECGGIYLVRLNEELSLPPSVFAHANNKSSSGRINLQARLVADGVQHFDTVPEGYRGALWLLVTPQSFPVLLHEGNAINQVRFFTGTPTLDLAEYEELFQANPVLFGLEGSPIPLTEAHVRPNGISMSVDLISYDIIGYKCSQTRGNVLDFDGRDHDPLEFFEPMPRPRNGHAVLKRNEFYILSTKEAIRIPKEYAVEMAAYDASKGEFRSHYAGFFDPGWGAGDDGSLKGWPGVLEVMTNDSDFILRDAQPICTMTYERLLEPAEFSYGTAEAGSHYGAQTGPRLSKHFRKA